MEKKPTPEEEQEKVGEMWAQIKYIVRGGHGDDFRREVYQVARSGKLERGHIELLWAVRNEENKQ